MALESVDIILNLEGNVRDLFNLGRNEPFPILGEGAPPIPHRRLLVAQAAGGVSVRRGYTPTGAEPIRLFQIDAGGASRLYDTFAAIQQGEYAASVTSGEIVRRIMGWEVDLSPEAEAYLLHPADFVEPNRAYVAGARDGEPYYFYTLPDATCLGLTDTNGEMAVFGDRALLAALGPTSQLAAIEPLMPERPAVGA